MKVSTEIDNNFGYEKITQLVDNIPLRIDVWVDKQNIIKRSFFLIIRNTYRFLLFFNALKCFIYHRNSVFGGFG
jgi:hypothetical protein